MSPWWMLALAITGITLACIFLMAICFFIASGGFDTWWDAYNLSVQTFFLIGYGVLAPNNDGTEAVALVTTFLGFIITAVFTGIVFIKFSLPYAALSWAPVACVHTINDKPCLVIRAAAIRGDERLLDCQFEMFVVGPRKSNEGQITLTSTQLKLRESDVLIMGAEAYLVHEIDPAGRLAKFFASDSQDFVIIVRAIAYSMMFQADVCTTKSYHIDDLLPGHFYDSIIVGRDSYKKRASMRSIALELPVGNVNSEKEIRKYAKYDAKDIKKYRDDLKTVVQPSPVTGLSKQPSVRHSTSKRLTRGCIDLKKLGETTCSNREARKVAKKLGLDRDSEFSFPNYDQARAPKDNDSDTESTGQNIDLSTKSKMDGSDATKYHDTKTLDSKGRLSHIFRRASLDTSARIPYDTSEDEPKRCCGYLKNVHWQEPKENRFENRGSFCQRLKSRLVRFRLNYWFMSLVQSPWYVMILVLALVYWVTIWIFSLLMYAGKHSLLDNGVVQERAPFITYIWWSHHTLSTVGYGTLSPASPYGDFVTTLEGILGMVLLAMMTGVTWAKFSHVQARILWSKIAVVSSTDGKPHFIFRCASLYEGHLMTTARMRCSVIFYGDKETDTAAQVSLPLKRSWNPAFALTGSFLHEIDASSPLLPILTSEHRKRFRLPKSIKKMRKVEKIVCLVEAYDSLFQRTFVSEKIYFIGTDTSEGTVRVGHSFVDILTKKTNPEGNPSVVIDYSKFHLSKLQRKFGYIRRRNPFNSDPTHINKNMINIPRTNKPPPPEEKKKSHMTKTRAKMKTNSIATVHHQISFIDVIAVSEGGNRIRR
eukprot:CAMPEP_0167745350 /NCGR_PEP_ID=MMETSP0110_2-20121227/3103_1 /TAXON_ID=629695 /ORGANISM="Gymnochlora sp., Strain CCMP2014" /LENGTH=818 /DNA_ID=CAMNT_0007629983 /DNA_START=329 /DNA_END=2785 /DNA_ORIENTATION=+